MKNTLPRYRYGQATFSGTVTVPKNYVFENHIDSFLKEDSKNLHVIGSLNDANYSRVSTRFCPCETYQVETVPIVEYIRHCQVCLNDLLKEEDLVFCGAQGLVLFKQQRSHWMPSGQLLSFDRKENFFKNEIEKIPYMQECANSITEFSTINFWSSLSSRNLSLLLFYRF